MGLVCSAVRLGPVSAETASHRPLFDLCFENLVIYKYFSFLVSYILSRDHKLWLDEGSVFVFTGLLIASQAIRVMFPFISYVYGFVIQNQAISEPLGSGGLKRPTADPFILPTFRMRREVHHTDGQRCPVTVHIRG